MKKVMRVNSQSGKGGASFIISEFLGVNMNKDEASKIWFELLTKTESIN